MSYAVIRDLKGIREENYESVKETLRIDEEPPARLIVHAAGATTEGWRIVEVWETRHWETTSLLIPSATAAA
jgi:hypothetical protein